jgi:hypothetical protein
VKRYLPVLAHRWDLLKNYSTHNSRLPLNTVYLLGITYTVPIKVDGNIVEV